MTTLKKYGYIWITGAMFIGAVIGQWTLGWYEYVDDQKAHNEPVETTQYVIKLGRGMMENWQSEFLQCLWEVAGLAFLWCVGSPQSKEGDDRREEKLDAILRRLDPEQTEQLLTQLDQRFPRK